MALIETAVPADEQRDLWLGQTALRCLWTIAALAIPILIAALWALRRLAPTRQRWACPAELECEPCLIILDLLRESRSDSNVQADFNVTNRGPVRIHPSHPS